MVQIGAIDVMCHSELVGKRGEEVVWTVSVIGSGEEETCTKSVL